jgi:GNAT superfamily N-acetyltransferase
VTTGRLRTAPLTPDRWPDLEALFGARGACGGCWCMWPRLPRAAFERQKGAANRRAFRAIVRKGPPPGVLLYVGSRPAGWCALGPRDTFARLSTSRSLAPVDARPAWAITCFFVARPYRGRGLSAVLLDAAIRFARRHGARLIEGYPVDPRSRRLADAFVWTGLPAMFERGGFVEVARRTPTRPILRREIRG